MVEKYYGKNSHRIIKIQRIEKALKLLDDSNLTISIGYKSKGNFYNAFKEVYGMTPTEYRKDSKIQ